MKKLIFILLFFLPVLLMAQTVFIMMPPSIDTSTSQGYDYTDLVHWYPLISDYNDAHGSDNGTNHGAAQGDSTINGVGATYFNEAEDDYVAVTGTNYGTSTFALFVTLKRHSVTGNDGVFVGGSGSACFLIDDSGHPMLFDRDGSYVTSTLIVALNTETFVGWSYAQDRNEVRFYVNGETEVMSYSEEFAANTTGIGGISADYNWDGLQQNIAIWNDSLTEANFDYYYNNGDFKGYEE